MPIYMDRHDVSDEVTAKHVAELHQKDLKIQHKYNCRGLTYWFDEERKTAFCLIDALNKQCLTEISTAHMRMNKNSGKYMHVVDDIFTAPGKNYIDHKTK